MSGKNQGKQGAKTRKKQKSMKRVKSEGQNKGMRLREIGGGQEGSIPTSPIKKPSKKCSRNKGPNQSPPKKHERGKRKGRNKGDEVEGDRKGRGGKHPPLKNQKNNKNKIYLYL